MRHFPRSALPPDLILISYLSLMFTHFVRSHSLEVENSVFTARRQTSRYSSPAAVEYSALQPFTPFALQG